MTKYRPYFKNLTLSHVHFTIRKEAHTLRYFGRNIMRKETLTEYQAKWEVMEKEVEEIIKKPVDDAFEKMDTDKSKKIDFKEF